MLRGGYVDETWAVDKNGKPFVLGYEPMGALSIRRRSAEHLHRVQIMPGRRSWSLLDEAA